ncbi:probable BOI-related E3 ubiquitin-protein ligase 2 [Prosopis cineraria]|uniref:probable BOI-related E3 ubiquitin-protein ligase 2 n=1 Tax=Prosopis cineraria TaxID=364024 RepID=UPI00240ED509|nr:probable BOI-related E3 ubiquitin-protein ligase 2 [Prosopis cineraria]
MAVHAHFYSEGTGLPVRFPDWAGTGQVLGMDNGLLLSLPQPSQPQFQQHQTYQNSGFGRNEGSSFSFTCYSFPSTSLSHALNTQLELQRHELDRMLLSQNEILRQALQHQRKEQVAILLSALESKSLSLMRQKEDDLMQAKKKTRELEDCLRKAEMESEAWQRLAKEKEAMVVSLTTTLEQVRERGVWDGNRAEDTGSCCGPSEERQYREEEEKVERRRKRMACKSCNSRSSCVLFLPCRHICSCYFCEALLDFCPVCNSAKEGCVEVLLA